MAMTASISRNNSISNQNTISDLETKMPIFWPVFFVSLNVCVLSFLAPLQLYKKSTVYSYYTIRDCYFTIADWFKLKGPSLQ